MSGAIELNSAVLAPIAWLRSVRVVHLRIYNPAIIRFRDRLLMAYRVDSGRRKTMQRRIALCQLDEKLNVIPGSVVPFSDTIPESDSRYYDPRFLVYNDRLFIHYNNNFQARPNRICLVELDPDTLAAKGVARPLVLDGPRQEIEKNWMLFPHDGELFAVYWIAPHTILSVNLKGEGDISCKLVYKTDWDVSVYADHYGPPFGGAPPVRRGNQYLSFFHSRRPVSPLRWVLRYWPIAPNVRLPRYLAAIEWRLRQPFGQVRYAAGAYAFEAAPPFRPLWITPAPVLCPEDHPPRQHHHRANPFTDGIVYPCGAIPWYDDGWLVSYGLHDEQCCLRHISVHREIIEGQSK